MEEREREIAREREFFLPVVNNSYFTLGSRNIMTVVLILEDFFHLFN